MGNDRRKASLLPSNIRCGRLSLFVCVLAFLPPSALAQAPVPYGVYLCQLANIDVLTEGIGTWQYQYPAVSATTPPNGCNTTTIQTTTPLSNSIPNSIMGEGPGYSDEASISVSGTAALGTLSASMDALGAANAGLASVSAQQSLGWIDTFTITTSSTIAKGTLVPLNITFRVSGKVVPPPSGVSSVYMQFLPGDGAAPVPLLISDPGIYVSSGDGTSTYGATLQVHVGDTFQLGARMNGLADSSVGGFLISEATIAGADSLLGPSNPNFTMTVNIDPGVPCVSYTTASGTPYFSGAAPASCNGQAPTCAQILGGNAITFGTNHNDTAEPTNDPDPTTIWMQFTPNYGLTLAEAAKRCFLVPSPSDPTFQSNPFNFQQIIALNFGPLPAVNVPPPPSIPTYDPPPGGYGYLPLYWAPPNGSTGDLPNYPLYYNPVALGTAQPWQCYAGPDNAITEANAESADGKTLTFCDTPANIYIPSGSTIADEFETYLVGITKCGDPDWPGGTCFGPAGPDQEEFVRFSAMGWTDGFNGTVGGISVTQNNMPIDPGSGTGGITIVYTGVAVPGDLNADGVVNCTDLDIVKASFGKKAGEPGFDLRADVWNHGIVNVLDLSFVARNVPAGTTCPSN